MTALRAKPAPGQRPVTLGPSAETRCRPAPAPGPGLQRSPPGSGKVWHKDAPGNAVYGQMMDSQEKPAGLLHPGIEPHRLDHHSGLGLKATLGFLCLLDSACASGELIEG